MIKSLKLGPQINGKFLTYNNDFTFTGNWKVVGNKLFLECSIREERFISNGWFKKPTKQVVNNKQYVDSDYFITCAEGHTDVTTPIEFIAAVKNINHE